MTRRRLLWHFLGIFLLAVMLFPSGAHPQQVKAAGIALRPPFDGTYRLTTFFDHHYPDYGDDNEITIYTGESVGDCNPHCYEGHNGYDWGIPEGTPVLAAADGVVIAAGCVSDNDPYGRKVIVGHAGGYYTLAAHLSQVNVVPGQSVRAGDMLGRSGDTGRGRQCPSDYGPHLHFRVSWRLSFERLCHRPLWLAGQRGRPAARLWHRAHRVPLAQPSRRPHQLL